SINRVARRQAGPVQCRQNDPRRVGVAFQIRELRPAPVLALFGGKGGLYCLNRIGRCGAFGQRPQVERLVLRGLRPLLEKPTAALLPRSFDGLTTFRRKRFVVEAVDLERPQGERRGGEPAALAG